MAIVGRVVFSPISQLLISDVGALKSQGGNNVEAPCINVGVGRVASGPVEGPGAMRDQPAVLSKMKICGAMPYPNPFICTSWLHTSLLKVSKLSSRTKQYWELCQNTVISGFNTRVTYLRVGDVPDIEPADNGRDACVRLERRLVLW